MTQPAFNIDSKKWLPILSGTVLLISFFLPWLSWAGNPVSGYTMPMGGFFSLSEKVGGPENPFPQFSFTFYLFWFIPVLAILIIALLIFKKKAAVPSFVAGALSLSLLTVYFLFSRTLLDFGVGTKVSTMIKAGFYVQAVAAIFLIITAFPVKRMVTKLIWLLAGPVFAYGAYMVGEKYIMSETHSATENVKADYTVNSVDLIKEFLANDTATNRKYLDKTMVINGNTSAVEILSDSTSTIRFADSTGSYAIFSLEKSELPRVQNIKKGDPVSLKGVCSGSIFSEILGTTSISFKRAILNQQ
jgi:tRNA_anti-like